MPGLLWAELRSGETLVHRSRGFRREPIWDPPEAPRIPEESALHHLKQKSWFPCKPQIIISISAPCSSFDFGPIASFGQTELRIRSSMSKDGGATVMGPN